VSEACHQSSDLRNPRHSGCAFRRPTAWNLSY